MRQKFQNFLEGSCLVTSGIKHGGGCVMVWGYFAASGPGQVAIIDGTMNSALYQKILKDPVWT